ncbi:MAG: formimidoylglutamase [Sediminibacterium sp.]
MTIAAISDFLEPISREAIFADEPIADRQLGHYISTFETEFPDLQSADLVLIGCSEMRGALPAAGASSAPDLIRKQLYRLFHWHTNVKVADIGNLKTGARLQDSYAALSSVTKELIEAGKKVLIMGGSHDNTLAQYQAYGALDRIIDATVIDARIDMNMEGILPEEIFLVEMFTGVPNFLRHFTHIGFQSFFTHPDMLEMIDRLRFDCFRLGKVKESIELMEPMIRKSDLVSFDISAIQHAHAPSNRLTPNGFSGEEACTLMQYAGMSNICSSIGIYGYFPEWDVHQMTARQIAQMIWYLIDGIRTGKEEAKLDSWHDFNVFNLVFAEINTVFLQSKRTGRWWMQVGEGQYVACSYQDYLTASNNDVPEAWLRALERQDS